MRLRHVHGHARRRMKEESVGFTNVTAVRSPALPVKASPGANPQSLPNSPPRCSRRAATQRGRWWRARERAPRITRWRGCQRVPALTYSAEDGSAQVQRNGGGSPQDAGRSAGRQHGASGAKPPADCAAAAPRPGNRSRSVSVGCRWVYRFSVPRSHFRHTSPGAHAHFVASGGKVCHSPVVADLRRRRFCWRGVRRFPGVSRLDNVIAFPDTSVSSRPTTSGACPGF